MSELLDSLNDQSLIEAQFRSSQFTDTFDPIVANAEGAITELTSATLTLGARSGGVQPIELPQPLGTGATPSFAALDLDGITITQLLTDSDTLDFGSTAAQSSSDLTITVTGAAVGDFVIPVMPEPPSGCAFVCLGVTATDTVTFRFLNPTSSSVDPSSGTFGALLIRL
jgi:hypothetical protein